MQLLKFAWRSLIRDHRCGELRLIVLSLLIASASLASVNFFTDRIEQELNTQPNRLLGADLVAEYGYEFDQDILDKAASLGLGYATTMQFRSMLQIQDEWKLVEVKAVSPEYPLRGKLLVVAENNSELQAAPPVSGNAWIDKRLARQLSTASSLRLGELDLRIGETIALEPDRGGELFNIAPRLMMSIDDVQATGLLGAGSRVKHALMLAGEKNAIREMRQHLQEIEGVRIQGVQDARPELQASLKRARQFMGMASLLTILLAGLALALAAQRYTERHLDQSALLRCLGAHRSYILRFYTIQLGIIAILAGVPGCLLGYAGQHLLTQIFADLSVSGSLPQPGLVPWLLAPIATVVILLGFSLPSFYALQKVPPLHVLRRSDKAKNHGILMTAITGIMALVALAPWRATDAELTINLIGGLLATLLLFAIAAWLLLLLLGKLSPRAASGWSYGLAMLPRKGAISILQIAAIAVGLCALFLLSQMREQVIESWRQQLPADTPNYFLINIDPQQVPRVTDILQDEHNGKVPLYPMIRGRLVEINGAAVRLEDYAEGRPRRLMRRNFNLSWLDELPPDNTVVDGAWWSEEDNDSALFTVEKDIAEIMKVKVGDTLTFDIAGEKHTAKIASFRVVAWDSFRVNFFVASNPTHLDDMPATWISSVYLPADKTGLLDGMLDEMPNITVLDVEVLLRQIRTIIEQIAKALELVFLMTLLAGLLVLLAALQITSADRNRDCAVLRTMGAGQGWLKQSHVTEFIALGSITTLLAMLVAYTAAALLSAKVFRLEFIPDYTAFAIGAVASIALIAITGIVCTKNARLEPPIQSLRL